MTSRPAPDPWERQPDETPPAFAAFAHYRDAGAFRSLRKTARELGKNDSLMERWSRTHSWRLRVNAWDAELDRIERLEIIESRRLMRKRHQDLAVEFQEKLMERLEDFDVKAIDPAVAIRWLDIATKVEREALAAPELVAAGRRQGDPEGEVDLSDLTDEEIKARMEDLRRDLDTALGEYDVDVDPGDDTEDEEAMA